MVMRDTFQLNREIAKTVNLSKDPPKDQPYPDQPIRSDDARGHKTAVLIATGPSLSPEQLNIVGDANVFSFGINNTYQIIPWLDVHLSCDGPWWRWYGHDPALREHSAESFTWYPDVAEWLGIRYIKAVDKRGISTDPGIIHINCGSGPMMMNLACHYGFEKLVLIGHDMKFAKDYDGRRRKIGSEPRHYFGEYPGPLRHFPSVRVRQGVLDGLIERYKQIAPEIADLGIDVVNCTPGSALDCFRMSTLEKEL